MRLLLSGTKAGCLPHDPRQRCVLDVMAVWAYARGQICTMRVLSPQQRADKETHKERMERFVPTMQPDAVRPFARCITSNSVLCFILLERCSIEVSNMDCDDRQNHNPIPPGVAAQQNCRADPALRGPCARYHREGDFEVCTTCQQHSAHMLLLEPAPTLVPQVPGIPALIPGPLPVLAALMGVPAAPLRTLGGRNRRRLSNGHGLIVNRFGNQVPRGQPGLGPPEFTIPPFIQRWLTPAEDQSHRLFAPPRTNPPFQGFLTRVCDVCEQAIQSEILHRRIGNIEPPSPDAPAAASYVAVPQPDMWEQYPEVSCTCKAKLGLRDPPLERLCFTHMEAVWNDLVEKKESNDRWLRNVEWNPRTQQVIKAREATKRTRTSAPGTWRACRVSQSASSS